MAKNKGIYKYFLLSILFILFFVSAYTDAKKLMYKGRVIHGHFAQPLWIPVSVNESDPNYYYFCVGHNAMTFYSNPTLSIGGLNLNAEDKVCTGDYIDLGNAEIKGEFFEYGGPSDSPSIEFVDNLTHVISAIDAGTFTRPTYTSPDQSGFSGKFTVICVKNCTLMLSEGLKKVDERKYKVVKEGEISFYMICEPECIQFVDTPAGTSYTGLFSWGNMYGYCDGLNLGAAKNINTKI
jgi:hypothetical protein